MALSPPAASKLHILAGIAGFCALIGVAQLLIGTELIRRFCAAPAPVPSAYPPVSILKPLCGVEPLTELALESFFLIEYPQFQLVFGVQSPVDPVLEVVEKLRARYPDRDVAVVVDDTLHGANRKVSNLINMYPAARYETLVMSDADIHVPPYFLDRVVAAMAEPGVGLVTTLYTGLPGTPHLATLMGANQINYTFLPGALLARKLGRQDCLGVTMALTKTVLAQVGGLAAVADNLADDQVLGRLVVARGYKLTLAQVIPATTVPEHDFAVLFRHELRWARTIRALVPVSYAASVLQISLFWCLLALVFSGGAAWAWILLMAVLGVRYAAARAIDSALGLAKAGDAWLFLVRDFCSFVIYVASFTGDKVHWRGQIMQADAGKILPH
ncbi:bacteriohopanetetrol glucosamine biosynthesis glycosyltransferase HpnI [Acidocella sp.]|uniref:bacteriohopanetetrol glucosamine biosynthesis glycosyltransferase HpnI n=1 Tax=Acidocella sp. TaxID=50710 RepID=UPI0026116159|nr:bacteriohopanetetrol glucosamine biosynthesis glycosyltransferase HpnI [Acidocella sp.]MDD2794314.1 bacteriohopanetetrol glucosamine biosynthesis glycosyltransferase HpnI [Acidocella sp.]